MCIRDSVNGSYRVKLARFPQRALRGAVSYTHLDVYKRQYVQLHQTSILIWFSLLSRPFRAGKALPLLAGTIRKEPQTEIVIARISLWELAWSAQIARISRLRRYSRGQHCSAFSAMPAFSELDWSVFLPNSQRARRARRVKGYAVFSVAGPKCP